MDIDRRRRHVAAVYRFIIAQPLGQRAQLIDQFCSADPTIREELNELLADSGSRASEATTSLTQLDSLVEPPGGTGEGGDDPSAHVILHYRLLHRLGEGGMGVVYKAHDMRLSRPVAVKFSKDESATNQAVLDEARAASALNHPNICTIHAVEEVPRNQLSLDAPGDSSLAPFIVMEYVDGTRLADQVRKGRLSPQRCLDVAVQLCRGIVAAHAQRIIHCDIKPHNVMVSPGGLIKIMDFGLARISTQRPSSMAPLSIVGTVGYMSPEQAAGAPLDARTDLFSVGVLLYEIATACRPFESTDLRTFRSEIAEMTVASPSELAPELPLAFDRIVMRCLSAERAERYQTAAELLADLELLQRELLTDGPQRSTLPGTDPHGQTRETERRRATVVMGEILPVAAEQDPGPLLTAVFDAIAKHGGTIDRVSGSSFVAFFGLPSASEHSTRNAVKAAIDIRNRTRTEAAPTTGVRLALCTGAVLAGTVGSGMQRRYSVTGEAVDGAADILTRVPPGHIYVGAATEADTRRDFVFDRVATAGESGPVFDVTATLQVDRADPPASALLGREAEVRILAAALKALREGQGRLVTVIGDAGIGKSRLVAELIGTAPDGILVLHGRTASEGQHLGYHLIIDLLKRWAGIRELDSRTVAQQKLEVLLERVSGPHSVEQLPFIASLLGLADEQPDQLVGAHMAGDVFAKLVLKHVRTLLAKAATRQPTLVYLEDLHWADQSSTDLLESLFKLVFDHGLMFLVSCRPGYADTSGRLLAACRSRYSSRAVQINLPPLPDAACATLLNACIGTGPVVAPQLREQIVKRSAGNPYFLREIAASVLSGAGTTIPETLEELLIARVDRLPDRTRSLLKVASVIGERFGYRTLVEVSASGLVDDGLEQLRRAGFVGTRQVGSETECFFLHALMQEAVYRTLTPASCRELHLKVASAVESLFAERLNEFYGVLALHYSRAAVRDKAEDYLEKAGAEALKSSASSEAIHYFQQVLTVYLEQEGRDAHPDRKAHFERNIAVALYNKGRMVEAAEHFDRALTYWHSALPRRRALRTARLLSDLFSLSRRLYLQRGQPSRTASARQIDIISTRHKKGQCVVTFDPQGYFVEAVAALGEINKCDIRSVPNGPGIYSSVSALFSVPGISFSIAGRILKYTRPFISDEDTRGLIQYRLSETALCLLTGRWDQVAPLDPGLVEACQRQGDHWFLWVYLYFYANLLTERGPYSEVAQVQQLLERLADYYENDLVRARGALVAARDSLKQGRRDAVALHNLTAAIPAVRAFGHRPNVVHALAFKARLELALGQIAAADESLKSAGAVLAQARRMPPFYSSGYRVAQLERLLYRLQTEGPTAPVPSDDDRAVIEAALQISLKNALDRAEILRLVGLHAWHTGDRHAAIRYLRMSVSDGTKFGAAIEVSRSQQVLAEYASNPH